MTIRPYSGISPKVAPTAYIDEGAHVIGDVTIGQDSSLWPGVVARGDVNFILIGDGTNIQDNSVLHVTHKTKDLPEGYPLIIGNNVTIGHNVVLHACRIDDLCLIGIGSIILDNAYLHPQTLVGAGSLVPPNAVLDGGHLWLGRPVKKVRALTDKELEYFAYSARHYVNIKNNYLEK